MPEPESSVQGVSAEVRDTIIEVLCGQALADHLGDVRNTEEKLWRLLGAEPLPYMHDAWEKDSAWAVTRARLAEAGLPLPAYLQGDDDDEDES